MLAWSWKITNFGIRIRLAVGQFVDSNPRDAFDFIGLVFFEGYVVFLHASHHASATTGTLVQVDDHAVSFGCCVVVSFFHQNLL
jgi:hypothetical protein